MKKSILFGACLWLYTSNALLAQNASSEKNNSTTAGNIEKKEERNKRAALASHTAYWAGDMDAAHKDFDKDVIQYSAARLEPRKGLDSLLIRSKRGYLPYITAFAESKAPAFTVVAEGDDVVLAYEQSGSWKGEYFGHKPTGRSFKMIDVRIYKFNDVGKIIEVWDVVPFFEVYRQAGGSEYFLTFSVNTLVEEKKFNEAIEVAKLNVRLSPESFNVYRALGTAYAAAGNKDLAIENFEKSLKIKPEENVYVKTELEKLKSN